MTKWHYENLIGLPGAYYVAELVIRFRFTISFVDADALVPIPESVPGRISISKNMDIS